MTNTINRRDFLKLAGAGAAATAVLTGCGPASRYVVREPYVRMPEYTYNGQFTTYATTCRECPAGCGILVRTTQGRAIKIEGNPDHPVNLGKTCARGQAALQGLYNPDRVQKPMRQTKRNNGTFNDTTWDEAITIVKDALTGGSPEEVVFLMGLNHDHLFDLVSGLTNALGAPAPVRFGAQHIFEARTTLVDAARIVFAQATLPFFDLANSDLVFSFGANFLETWLNPVAYARGFSFLRKGQVGRRGYLVQFEPRLSQTAANADEWIPVRPGTEGHLALALGRLLAEKQGGAIPNAFVDVDVVKISQLTGVETTVLNRLAGLLVAAGHPLLIPGGSSMGQVNGLEAAKAILAVNLQLKNSGLPGGIFFTPDIPVHAENTTTLMTMPDANDLVQKMNSGKVKTLFVHGINPVFELPASLGFDQALAKVPQVISFSPFLDETAMAADLVLPDHTSLESWGYQRALTGGDRGVISGGQPAVAPYYDTRASGDVLLAAIQAAGGDMASKLPYKDVLEFIKASLTGLVTINGWYNDQEINSFMTHFQQFGGWWSMDPGLVNPPASTLLDSPINIADPEFDGDGKYILFIFPSPLLGDGSGANKPWLQETPDPVTTVMWNTWVEINPATADDLGLENDDIVRLVSPFGSLEASVYRYPAIRPEVIGIPFGQGHSAYGRYATGRGANPASLLGLKLNGSGDLAFAGTRVKIERTGRKRALSRFESRIGVYGEGLQE